MLKTLLPLLTLLASSRTALAAVYEAEDGVLTGTTVATQSSGYSGTGYVTNFVDSSTSLTINVQASSAGLYDFLVTYQAPYGEKYTSVSLNGLPNGQLHFPETTTFTTVSGGQLLLNSGANSITFNTNWGWYFIDKIEINPAAPPPPHQVTGALTNPNASQAARTLMNFLVSKYGTNIISGQQDPASYAWVQSNIGKSPAIIGLDMMDYSPSRVARGTTSMAVEEAIAFDANQTIVNFCWHWNAPTDLIDSGDQLWWRGFYTTATTFDLAAALADKTSERYGLLISDIDAIAVQLKRLQDANVPVVWRPLHEAEGGWFWWGRNQNPEPAKELYRIMHDRLTNYHHLNNLIWVWNSISPAWYPGDDVVDILSYDSYPPTPGDHGALSSVYSGLVALGQDRKLVALSEVGTIPDADLMQAYRADWSYFVTWNGEFISGNTHNTVSFLNSLYYNPYVLNHNDIYGWKNGIATSSSSVVSSTSRASSSSTSRSTSTSRSSSSTRSSSTSRSSSSSRRSSSSTRTTSTSRTPSITTAYPIVTQTLWGQCGGTYYHGPIICTSGSTCVAVAPPWYYQCLP